MSVPRPLTRRARQLRKAETEAERRLWHLLRDRRLSGLKWRRQVPLGLYIVDFLCPEKRLVVECDGAQHGGAHDAVRDAWLAAQGFTVLRFPNHVILQNPVSITDTLLARSGLQF